MNQRDDLGAKTPGDWLAVVRAGQSWGFPGCYGQGGTKCTAVPSPTAALGTHAAVSGVAIVTGQLGSTLGTGAVVAEWVTGKVKFVRLTATRATGTRAAPSRSSPASRTRCRCSSTRTARCSWATGRRARSTASRRDGDLAHLVPAVLVDELTHDPRRLEQGLGHARRSRPRSARSRRGRDRRRRRRMPRPARIRSACRRCATTRTRGCRARLASPR